MGTAPSTGPRLKMTLVPTVSMPVEVHDKVLRELAAIGFQGRIAYHNNSDPLIFKDLHVFVARAKTLVPQSYSRSFPMGVPSQWGRLMR